MHTADTPAVRHTPVLYWFHDAQVMTNAARQAGVELVPAAGGLEECYAGLVDLARRAHPSGAGTHRIVVGGVGAGGGLAAALALLARDRGGPDLAGHLLLSPEPAGGDPEGLSPAFIDVGATDPFREHSVDYACRIWATGGEAELHLWPGTPGPAVGREAAAARLHWLRRVLG